MNQMLITAVNHGRYLYVFRLKTIPHTIVLLKEELNDNKFKNNIAEAISFGVLYQISYKYRSPRTYLFEVGLALTQGQLTLGENYPNLK